MEVTICQVVEEAGKLIARCPVEHETFVELLGDWNHWVFEYVSEIPGFLMGLLLWPVIGPSVKSVWQRWFHRHDACCAVHPDEVSGMDDSFGQ